MQIRIFILLMILVQASFVNAQSNSEFQQQLQAIVSSKDAKTGLAIWMPDTGDSVSIYGDSHFPMQSVFKFPIAMKVLSLVDAGVLSLDQKVRIRKNELLPGLYSPLRDKYPNGASLSLSEILEYTVSLSDNVGCDVLLKLLGGPQVVDSFLKEHGIGDVAIEINEEVMQHNWDLQFKNWITPNASNKLLEMFHENSNGLLSASSHDFLLQVMQHTKTGKARLKGQLPMGTIVAHKTGYSGIREGVTAAVNDVGIVYLPDGRYFYISVFVSESKEDFDSNEGIIAAVAKAAWDYFYLP
jgi:beta-lactamase class A